MGDSAYQHEECVPIELLHLVDRFDGQFSIVVIVFLQDCQEAIDIGKWLSKVHGWT
jgi:hypothetical protein